MNNKIEVFKNEQFGEVRTILDGETLLFCGSDVARALGYARPGKAIIDHCKGVLKRDTLTSGGTQSLSYITEGDVYRLIVHSKLPSAERFEHWLFDEVVPTIRKTGGYMTDSLLERIQKEPAVIVEFAQALILEKNRVKALECELNTAKPKADYYDAFINPDDCTNIRTTAKELKIPERKFVKFLLNEGYLFRSPSGQLLPYNKDSNAGLFIVRDFVTYCYTGSQTYFTPKGKDVIRMKFQKKCLTKMRQAARRDGKTVLYVSHNMATIRDLCDRCIVLDKGKVIFDGDVDEGIALYLSTKSQAADFVDYSDFKRDNWFKRDNLRLQSVRVLVPSVEAIERTQPVRIHCVIKAQESVERVGLRLEVRDEVGNPLATSCLYDLNLHEGDSEFTAQYDLSVLSPGKYSNYFTLFTAGEGGAHTVEDWVPGIQFRMVDTFTSGHLEWNAKDWGNIRLPEAVLCKENAE